MTAAETTLLTIGHSTHSFDEFFALLVRQRVAGIADVRSQPYGHFEHFNREPLAAALQIEGIDYVFLGRELGARREERGCYVNGQARYDRIAHLSAFQDGLTRLVRGAARRRIAILCAEKEPLHCHRTILVCRHLRGRGLHLQHILADGSVEEHSHAELRLVRQLDITRGLFEQHLTDADLIERAYNERSLEIAYRADAAEEATA